MLVRHGSPPVIPALEGGRVNAQSMLVAITGPASKFSLDGHDSLNKVEKQMKTPNTNLRPAYECITLYTHTQTHAIT